MYATSHTPMRIRPVHTRQGCIRATRPGRSNERRAAIDEQTR